MRYFWPGCGGIAQSSVYPTGDGETGACYTSWQVALVRRVPGNVLPLRAYRIPAWPEDPPEWEAGWEAEVEVHQTTLGGEGSEPSLTLLARTPIGCFRIELVEPNPVGYQSRPSMAEMEDLWLNLVGADEAARTMLAREGAAVVAKRVEQREEWLHRG